MCCVLISLRQIFEIHILKLQKIKLVIAGFCFFDSVINKPFLCSPDCAYSLAFCCRTYSWKWGCFTSGCRCLNFPLCHQLFAPPSFYFCLGGGLFKHPRLLNLLAGVSLLSKVAELRLERSLTPLDFAHSLLALGLGLLLEPLLFRQAGGLFGGAGEGELFFGWLKLFKSVTDCFCCLAFWQSATDCM